MVRLFTVMGWLLLAGWVAALGYLGWEMTRIGKAGRERLMLAILLVFGSVVFFALAEQAGSSLNQFAERNTSLPQNGFWSMTPAQTQSFNAGFILIFAPALSWIWARLGKRGRDPNPLVKFGLALIQIGVGFFVLVWGAAYADSNFRTPLFFLAFSYLLQTTGELFLSPVGLSEMTKLAPARMISTLMAIWSSATSGAQYVAGLIARTSPPPTPSAAVVLDPPQGAGHLHPHLPDHRLRGVAFGVAFLAVSPWLRHWAHDVGDAGAHPG